MRGGESDDEVGLLPLLGRPVSENFPSIILMNGLCLCQSLAGIMERLVTPNDPLESTRLIYAFACGA